MVLWRGYEFWRCSLISDLWSLSPRILCVKGLIPDQPNLFLDSGVRDSLVVTVKHKIIFCKINFKIPPPPKYSKKFWHFDRARENSILGALTSYPWEMNLRRHSLNRQDYTKYYVKLRTQWDQNNQSSGTGMDEH